MASWPLEPRTSRWLSLAVLMFVCTILLVIWAFLVPIFESPDEPHHWNNAQYINAHLELPPYNGVYEEGNQAPLYYLLMSPLASRTATPPLLARIVNGRFDVPCPPHIFENCPADLHKYWPIRRVRLATAGLSLIGVLFTAVTAFEITQSMLCALISAALIGFLPQFDFRGATVNNDAAVAVFSAIATYFIVRMTVRGFEMIPALFGSIAIALAFLSKINAIVLAPPFLACILLTASDWKTRVRRSGLLVFSGLIVLPWLIRNKELYGDFLASRAMLRTVPLAVHMQSLASSYFTTTFPQLTFQSSIGYFGWMNVVLPTSIYRGYEIVLILACVGVFFVFLRRPKKRWAIVLLASIPVMSLAVMIDFNLAFPQPQGRLLFPSLSAVVILVTLGLGAIMRARKYVAAGVLIGSLAVNVYALTDVIYPAYWRDKPMAEIQDVAVPDTMMKGQPPGPLLSGQRFTQSFVAEHDRLSAVQVEVTGYGRSIKHGSFRISLSGNQGGPVIATTEWAASTIPNCCVYAPLTFPPLLHSAGKTYFISISTQGLIPPDAITVFLSGTDVYAGGEFSIDGKGTRQDTSFRTYYSPLGPSCSGCPESAAILDARMGSAGKRRR